MDLRRLVTYIIIGSTILSAIFIISFRINILNNPVIAAVLALSFFSAIAIFVIALDPYILNPNRKINMIDDIIVIISILTYTLISVFLINGYGTDDMEYIATAINYLIHGINPYLQSYHPHNVEPTYLLNGNIASSYIYPPLSFLLYTPLYLILDLLKIKLYYINILNIIFEDLLAIIIYLQGRKRKDPIATLPIIFIFITSGLLAPSFAGVNSSVWAVFIALSYVYNGKKSGIFLALADSFNQIPWVITPFLLIYKKKDLLNVLKGFLTSILLINVPFLIWNPYAFLHIITLDEKTIPVAFTGFTILNFTTLFSVEPWFFTYAMALSGAFLIYIYYRFFDRLKESLWIFPLIIMWFSWRTLTSYFIMWPQLMFLSIFNINSYNMEIPKIHLSINRKEILSVLFVLLISLVSAGEFSHIQYVDQDPIQIINVIIPESEHNSTYINQLYIVVKNIKNETINITLVRVSIPNCLNMVWNFTKVEIPPNSTGVVFAYTQNPALYINSTSFTVQVYSNCYISSYKVIRNFTEYNTTLTHEYSISASGT
ncbi:hypothetical protein D1867_08665 [Acidianus infernus]|uniref:DUF2029 domain-containing protein n=1 Tax=Acidianus infernus TaxID=12915 RepID=A0A6A9QN14_ACIIN|nr:hypothetical protein [Acidianus infernus]MUM65308.1 hypothetical protein [Acidianus infernus]